MTVLHYATDLSAAIWVDAFLPEQQRLKEVYQTKYTETPESIDIDFDHNDADWLVGSVLDELQLRLYKENAIPTTYFYFCHRFGIAPEVAALVNELERYSSEHGDKKYRQIVAVSRREDLTHVELFVHRAVKDLELEIRHDYKDFQAFKRSVEGLVKLITEPFDAPPSAAVRAVRQFGLEKLDVGYSP